MKRAISVFLAILLIAMNIPFAAGASNTVPSNADGALMDNDLKISSTNSLGNLFMEPINGRQEQLEENNGCNVFSVEILGKTAFVTYETLEKATLVVAIYDEDDLQMLASGSILVSEEETEATVTIDADTMPQYFRVRAYLIEPETLRPLCTEYTSPLYTR